MQTNIMGDNHIKSYLITSSAKRSNIFRLDLSDDTTSWCLCSQWTGLWGRRQRLELRNWLLYCLPNGESDTQQHVVMSVPVYIWTWCVTLDCWYGCHRVSRPDKQDTWHQLERRHQDWICREFRETDREWRQHIWTIWALLGREGDEAIGIGYLSSG